MLGNRKTALLRVLTHRWPVVNVPSASEGNDLLMEAFVKMREEMDSKFAAQNKKNAAQAMDISSLKSENAAQNQKIAAQNQKIAAQNQKIAAQNKKIAVQAKDIAVLKSKVSKLSTVAEGERILFLINEATSDWTRLAILAMTCQKGADMSKGEYSKVYLLSLRHYTNPSTAGFQALVRKRPDQWAQFCSMVEEKFGFDISGLPHIHEILSTKRNELGHPPRVKNKDDLHLWKDLCRPDPQIEEVSTSTLDARLSNIKISIDDPEKTLRPMMDTTHTIASEYDKVIGDRGQGLVFILACKVGDEVDDKVGSKEAIKSRLDELVKEKGQLRAEMKRLVKIGMDKQNPKAEIGL